MLPSDDAGSQLTSDEQARADRLAFTNSTLDESVAATARRLGDATIRGTGFRFLSPVADTLLTLAFDQQDNWDFRQAIAEEKQVRQFAVGTSASHFRLVFGWLCLLVARGGSLAASVFSALPAWCSFDPLPIVESFQTVKDTRKQNLLGESLSNIAMRK